MRSDCRMQILRFSRIDKQRRHSEGALATEESPAWQGQRIYKFAFLRILKILPAQKAGGFFASLTLAQNDGVVRICRNFD